MKIERRSSTGYRVVADDGKVLFLGQTEGEAKRYIEVENMAKGIVWQGKAIQ